MALKENDVVRSSGDLQQPLNEQLANWAVSYVKLHQFHWFVKGPHFQELHAKFEELYEMAAASLDQLAERMLSVGLKPASTMKEYLSLATIQEGSGGRDTDMLAAVATDFGTMAEGMKQAAEIADELGDTPTADLLNEHINELQKQIWMLNATLGK